MEFSSKIFVAGHNGLVGSAIVRKLKKYGYTNILCVPQNIIDLRSQASVNAWFSYNRPEYVFLAAAKVGGINYNKTFPADFIYDNLQIQNNVIDSAYRNGTKKLLFLGSACIYPKITEQPIKEEYLLSGYLEPTNEAYALAKIAGLKMCQMYNQQYGFNAISLMPANIYGPNDNFNIEQCHVIPAMIRKIIDAKENNTDSITFFGDGIPKREFLHVDDLADACVFLMNNYDDPSHINVGSSEEYSISELAEIITNIIGFNGKITWDTAKPNGSPRRKLDNTKINNLGWSPKITLIDGIQETIKWYLKTGGKKDV